MRSMIHDVGLLLRLSFTALVFVVEVWRWMCRDSGALGGFVLGSSKP